MQKKTIKPKWKLDQERRERAFRKASKAGKRVMIARDALSQIKAKKYRPIQHSWAKINSKKRVKIGEDLCEVIDRSTCLCCAYGGLMLSQIRILDKAPVGRVYSFDIHSTSIDRNDPVDQLADFFTDQQLFLIERAFEQGGGAIQNEVSQDMLRSAASTRAVIFGYKYKNNTERLVAILQNIIKNKGRFIP